MRKIKYLAFNGKELVPVISLDSMKDGEPIVLVSEDGSGDLPLKNLGKVPVYQFTGLKDKSGQKDICDGHIEESGNVIGYHTERACFALFDGRGRLMSYPLSNNYHTIIGHISTNPELLK